MKRLIMIIAAATVIATGAMAQRPLVVIPLPAMQKEADARCYAFIMNGVIGFKKLGESPTEMMSASQIHMEKVFKRSSDIIFAKWSKDGKVQEDFAKKSMDWFSVRIPKQYHHDVEYHIKLGQTKSMSEAIAGDNISYQTYACVIETLGKTMK